MFTTEKECREYKVPFFNTKEELIAFIDSLDEANNDYGTAAHAMSLAGVAAFNYIAHKFGVTGFQASCADLDMLRRTRSIDGPFMIIQLSDYLYPQYDLVKRLEEFIENNREWIKEEAQRKLTSTTHPATIASSVLAHWQKLSK